MHEEFIFKYRFEAHLLLKQSSQYRNRVKIYSIICFKNYSNHLFSKIGKAANNLKIKSFVTLYNAAFLEI